MGQRGRPPKAEPSETIVRSWALPKALYERLQEIAANEQRDTTKQVVKILQDFVDKYDRETEPGQISELLAA